jgi:hypothetical protein
MKIKAWLFDNFLSNKNFTILAELGDLSKYKYGQMSLILKKWDKNIELNKDFRDVTWQNRSTLLKIRYTTNTDQFVRILNEEWKLLDMKFNRQ